MKVINHQQTIKVHHDCETQSWCSLKDTGAYIYANHPSTRLACWCFNYDGTEFILTPFNLDVNNKIGQLLVKLAKDPNVIFYAHNASFEQYLWQAQMVPLGFPELPITKWRCTMAMAQSHGLPGGLGKAVKALHLGIEKDEEGRKVMMYLSKPQKLKGETEKRLLNYIDCPDKFETLYEYCHQDVRTEEALDNELSDLSPKEQKIWFIDQRINQTGLRLDMPKIHKAKEIADKQMSKLLRDFESTTNFLVRSPKCRDKYKDWLHSKGAVDAYDTKSETLNKLDFETLPPEVEKSVNLANRINKASLAKYGAMIQRSKDGIMREMYVYHGAHTARWAARGIQIQNLPRPIVCEDTIVDMLGYLSPEQILMFYSDVNIALSSALRGMIIAREGKQFFCGDYSQIEARMLAYLAGEDEILQLYRDGIDAYRVTAGGLYSIPVEDVTKDQRQAGKTCDLAFGYAGGIAAEARFSDTYGVDLEALYPEVWSSATHVERESAVKHYVLYLKRHIADKVKAPPKSKEFGYTANILKDRWRANRPLVCQYWADMEDGAIEAVLEPGKEVKCGRGSWFMHKQFLVRKLPSGRCMLYPYPKLYQKKRSPKASASSRKYPHYTLSYRRLDPIKNQWVRHTTYGGQFVENEDQAASRDVQAAAMLRLEEKFPVLLHAHDELLSEVTDKFGEDEEIEFTKLMGVQLKWTGDYNTGLPIDVDFWSGMRYRK